MQSWLSSLRGKPHEKSESVVVIKPSDHSNWLGYTIAVIVVGAAFGNMFMAGKIKNVMRAKMPDVEQFMPKNKPNFTANGPTASQSTQKGDTYGRKSGDYRYSSNKKKSESNDFLPAGLTNIPPYIKTHFDNLQLPVTVLLTEKTVKDAYRSEAMKHHPDRIANDTPGAEALKKQNELKFKEISNSYKFLLRNFSNRKKRGSLADMAGDEVV